LSGGIPFSGTPGTNELVLGIPKVSAERDVGACRLLCFLRGTGSGSSSQIFSEGPGSPADSDRRSRERRYWKPPVMIWTGDSSKGEARQEAWQMVRWTIPLIDEDIFPPGMEDLD
jgi:hypothetical protein